MLYTELTKKAMRLSYKAHEGQMDKGGVPYVFHPFHVAEQMQTEHEICLALLHDVVEDSDFTMEDVAALGFPEEVLRGLAAITRLPGEDYMAYIRRVKQEPLAVRVKLRDIEHNSMAERMSGDAAEWEERMQKYAAAKALLLSEEEDA